MMTCIEPHVRARSRLFVGALAGAALGALVAAAPAAGANKACDLLTGSELETALGTKVALRGSGAPGVEMCMGQVPTARVLLRLAAGPAGDGSKERAGLDMARKMGAEVEVKTFGPITCSTMLPPPSLAEHGFTTACTVRKANAVAGVEVTAKTRKGMVSIEKLRPLAELMASRF